MKRLHWIALGAMLAVAGVVGATGYPERVGETDAQIDRVRGLIDATAIDVVDATSLKIGGTAVTSTAAELNILDTVTATAAELNYLDITTLGTGAASKAVVLDAGDDYTWPSAGILTYGGGAINATGAEINAAADLSVNMVAAGATLTIDATHHNKTVLFDQATGSVITLPAATGTGLCVKFVVSVTATSNLHSINAAGTDEYAGIIHAVDTDTSDTVAVYPAVAADDFDAIDMDGSTKGGLIGDWLEICDVVTGTWALKGWINQTGTAASPLSST